MAMTPADEVWNRACFVDVDRWQSLTSPGDRALADLLLLHGEAMNNGLLHAVEVMDPDEIAAAIHGFRYFGLDEAAAVVEDIAGRLVEALDGDVAGRLEAEADERYVSVVESDSVLVRAFEVKYKRDPSDFAPVDE